MSLFRTLRESCPNGKTCPTLHLGPVGDLFVQGYVITDEGRLADLGLPVGEAVVRIPADAASALLPELMMRIEEISHSMMWVDARHDLFVRGTVVNDPDLLVELDLPPGETVVCIPADAASVLLPEIVGSASA